MLEKLQPLKDPIEKRYKELQGLLSDPQIIQNRSEFQKYTREYSHIAKIISKFREWDDVVCELHKTEEIVSNDDPEISELARNEIETLNNKKMSLERELQRLLLPSDPYDEKNIIIEVRAGTGGDEAGLFAGDLFRMYTRFAETKSWKIEVLSSNPGSWGGVKEIIFLVKGKGAYSQLKYEKGVHRVQRVPVTESGGRIHTSAVTVAVLPEAEEIDLIIDPRDLKIDVYRSSGPGGQHVNVTDSAVRITHLPTGVVVQCQDERSQLKNKEKAMKILRSHILQKLHQQQEEEVARVRKSQVGRGDRSEKIRTYNFPQDRVTDHRIAETFHNIEGILDGGLGPIVNALIEAEEIEKLENINVLNEDS